MSVIEATWATVASTRFMSGKMDSETLVYLDLLEAPLSCALTASITTYTVTWRVSFVKCVQSGTYILEVDLLSSCACQLFSQLYPPKGIVCDCSPSRLLLTSL